MKMRSAEREAVILRAREWRLLRDRQCLPTVRVALRAELPMHRVVELLCAASEPNEYEIIAIDAALAKQIKIR